MSVESVTRREKRTNITEEGAGKVLGRTLEDTTKDLSLAMMRD
jgi:hypothetical protein